MIRNLKPVFEESLEPVKKSRIVNALSDINSNFGSPFRLTPKPTAHIASRETQHKEKIPKTVQEATLPIIPIFPAIISHLKYEFRSDNELVCKQVQHLPDSGPRRIPSELDKLPITDGDNLLRYSNSPL